MDASTSAKSWSTSSPCGPGGSDFVDHSGRHAEAFQGLSPHIHAAIVEAHVRGALIGEIPAEDIDALVAPLLTEAGAKSFCRRFVQADEAHTAEIEPTFGQIRCPVRVVWGTDDPWIPIERGRALHPAIGHGGVEAMAGVGHLPQLEAPEAMLEAIAV